MPNVTCPSCGEKGRIPPQFIGTRIKCRKCNSSFLVTPAVPKAAVGQAAPVPETVGAFAPSATGGIEVAGLDDSAWALTSVAPAEHDHAPVRHEETSPFTSPAENLPAPGGRKEYKILTPKDRYFDGKFDLEKLEHALNHFAKQGWVVKGMSTPHIAGFSGGEKEQLIVLLER